MPQFPLLASPATYRPCPQDMHVHHALREHWLKHFASHFDTVVEMAIETYGPSAAGAADACRRAFVALLEQARENPGSLPRLDLYFFDLVRQEMLVRHGIPDPFAGLKTRENEAMLSLYPQIIAELDAQSASDRELLLLIEGVFAGNIFDMGTHATMHRFREESPDFWGIRDEFCGKRPWLIDDFDEFLRKMRRFSPKSAVFRKAIVFVDNAGSDCILGMIPFARYLARRGTQVCLAANHRPALNDITASELTALLPRVAALDPVLADLLTRQRIRVVDSGSIAPLLDLGDVSPELCCAAADADLVVLEGMGRALASNFDAAFTVDAVKVCMIKDPAMAGLYGGKNFDTVFRYEPHP